MVVIKWKPIEDLPDDWRPLASSELEAIGAIWKDQSVRLKQNDAFVQFNERLAREWAIETGILERIYTIDRGVTQLLIEKGLEASLIPHGCSDRPAEEVASILQDHREALEGLFDFVSQKRDLSTSYIKTLHQVMTRNQNTTIAIDSLGQLVETAMLHGEWKKTPNNPSRLINGEKVHEYCPPEHVALEMDRLIKMHLEHEHENIPPEIEAAWLHHRFTQIHPFKDGNGRIARALASLIYIRNRWFPLVINVEQRDEYLRACETADEGNIKPLVELFTRTQKKAFVKALSISEIVLGERESYQQIIAAATDRLRERKHKPLPNQVIKISSRLEDTTVNKFKEIAVEIYAQLKELDRDYEVYVDWSSLSTDFWFRRQIVEVAKKNDYFADFRTYAAWVRLVIKEERQVSLIISFHALGRQFLGIMAASAFLLYRDKTEDQQVIEDGPYQVCDGIFEYSYQEEADKILARFQDWLEKSVKTALYQWRKQL